MEITKAVRNIFDRLRALREASGFGQCAFAFTIGMNKNRYGEIETYATNCTIQNFLIMCAHLNVKPWQVLFASLDKDWDEMAAEIKRNQGQKPK